VVQVAEGQRVQVLMEHLALLTRVVVVVVLQALTLQEKVVQELLLLDTQQHKEK
jgi:hypothetical protein